MQHMHTPAKGGTVAPASSPPSLHLSLLLGPAAPAGTLPLLLPATMPPKKQAEEKPRPLLGRFRTNLKASAPLLRWQQSWKLGAGSWELSWPGCISSASRQRGALCL